LIKSAVRVLERQPTVLTGSRKLSSLYSAAGHTTGASSSQSAGAPGAGQDLIREDVRRLIDDAQATPQWQRLLLLEYATMLWEAGQSDAAAEQFRLAAQLSVPEGTESVIGEGYANLGRALALASAGRVEEGVKLAQAVAAGTRGNHLHELASALVVSFAAQQQEKGKVEKCDVAPLK
jgi:hypothetical protein